MNVESKTLGRHLVDTMCHEVGNPTHTMGILIEKMESGQTLTKEEVSALVKAHGRIHLSLKRFRKMAKTNFKGLSIDSDKSGFIASIELEAF